MVPTTTTRFKTKTDNDIYIERERELRILPSREARPRAKYFFFNQTDLTYNCKIKIIDFTKEK